MRGGRKKEGGRESRERDTILRTKIDLGDIKVMISHPRGHHRGPDDRRYHRHHDVHQGATRGPPGRSAGGTTTRIPLHVLGLPFLSFSGVDVLVRNVPTSVGRRRVGGSIVIVSAIGGSRGPRTRRRGAGRGRTGRGGTGTGRTRTRGRMKKVGMESIEERAPP